uniref:pirin family protein n=1 Tax=Flavobacterium sp. TaxID=239 RepID=UPI00404A6CAF
MSNIQVIVPERAADIGNFTVGRLLPFRQKRAVGPFVFIDHMGPAALAAGENLDVNPHPHIGLSTLTYLFEGSIMHCDSLGTEIAITPGAVNWMTAGRGIVHSERTPEALKNTTKTLHGLQIWVALPTALETCEPSFHHIKADELPTWAENNIHFKLIAGKIFGHESPVPVYSPLFLLEISTTKRQKISFGEGLFGEHGIYILQGQIEQEGHVYESKQILVAKENIVCSFTMEANTKIYLFGGEPFPEERFIYWNFVNSDKNRIEEAKEDWKNQRFPKIPGDDSFVKLP